MTLTAVKTEPNLDERIASVLGGDQLSSVDLAALLAEVGGAIDAADQEGREAYARSLDPSIIDGGARGRAHDSEFRAARLRNGQARLKELHATVTNREEKARWSAEGRVIEQKIADLARELATVYPETVSRLVNLFQRIAVANREASSFTNRSPAGHYVSSVEDSISGAAKIIDKVRLPSTVKGAIDVWPPKSTWVTDYAETVRAVMQSVAPPTEAERAAEGARVIAHAENMEAGRLRLNNELAARVRDNDAEIRRLTSGELPR